MEQAPYMRVGSKPRLASLFVRRTGIEPAVSGFEVSQRLATSVCGNGVAAAAWWKRKWQSCVRHPKARRTAGLLCPVWMAITRSYKYETARKTGFLCPGAVLVMRWSKDGLVRFLTYRCPCPEEMGRLCRLPGYWPGARSCQCHEVSRPWPCGPVWSSLRVQS